MSFIIRHGDLLIARPHLRRCFVPALLAIGRSMHLVALIENLDAWRCGYIHWSWVVQVMVLAWLLQAICLVVEFGALTRVIQFENLRLDGRVGFFLLKTRRRPVHIFGAARKQNRIICFFCVLCHQWLSFVQEPHSLIGLAWNFAHFQPTGVCLEELGLLKLITTSLRHAFCPVRARC